MACDASRKMDAQSYVRTRTAGVGQIRKALSWLCSAVAAVAFVDKR